MVERIAFKGHPILKEGKYEKRGKYQPSRTEQLLEKICESFGTTLQSGYTNPINGSKLIRLSNPVVVTHPNGSLKLLQFQYTRFSPLNSGRAYDIYVQNRAYEKGKRKISNKRFMDEISQQHPELDDFEEVTNNQYIEHLKVHRFEKGLYFAAYNIKDTQGLENKIKPFLIHDHYTYEFDDKVPYIHITFQIQPYFVIADSHTESTKEVYDELTISFPEVAREHEKNMSTGLSLHPLDKMDRTKIYTQPEKVFELNEGLGLRLWESCKIHSEMPRGVTMGFITAYLRRLCLGKEFY